MRVGPGPACLGDDGLHLSAWPRGGGEEGAEEDEAACAVGARTGRFWLNSLQGVPAKGLCRVRMTDADFNLSASVT